MRSLFFNFLNILLFALITTAITAQPSEDGPITDLGTVSNDGDLQPNIYKFCLDDDNQLIIKVRVVIDNLPPVYDDMYVEFNVDGQTNVVPVGNFTSVTLENGAPALEFIAESLPFDFSQACNNSEEEFVAVYISYRLVTSQGDGYVTYPACDYQNSMFTCSVYPYAPWCIGGDLPFYNTGFSGPSGEPNPVCFDSWFSGGYAAWLYCDCDEIIIHIPPKDDHLNGGDYFDGDIIIDNRADLETKINVYPNPFGELMNIESNNESIRQIEVYNSNGQLVLNKVYNSDKNQNVSLNTTELANGLYLLRIATTSGIKVVKVLK